jgi:cell division protein FtsX
MKRLAMIMGIVSAVVLVLGLVESLTNYQWAQGDQDPLFGDPRILLNDGMTTLIAGGFLLIGSVIMWMLARRKADRDQRL